MTLKAFHGDSAVKTKLLDGVRERWNARRLLPTSLLRFDEENNIYSLCGALAGTQDIATFVERTGIPHELAMLCEALMLAGIEVAGVPGPPPTFEIQAADDTMAFGMQWLEAIRPGANLTTVTPRFIVSFLEFTLTPEFALGAHIEQVSRDVALRILDGWKRELAGTPIDAKEWRAIRKQAQAAADQVTDPWGEPYRAMLEGLGWPVGGLGAEFVGMFMGVAKTWVALVQQPLLSAEDQELQVLILKGWHRYGRALREHDGDEVAAGQVLAEAVEENKAMMTLGDPVVRERVRAGKLKTYSVVASALRVPMEEMLRLIRAA